VPFLPSDIFLPSKIFLPSGIGKQLPYNQIEPMENTTNTDQKTPLIRNGVSRLTTDKAWFRDCAFENIRGLSFDIDWARQALGVQALMNGLTLYSAAGYGQAKEKDYDGFLEKLKATLPQMEKVIEDIGETDSAWFCGVWDHGCAQVAHNKESKTFEINLISLDKEECIKLHKLCDDGLELPRSSGRVFVMVSGPGGIELQAVGVASVPLERTNYPDDVLGAFDHVVKDFQNTTPCGRIVILDGEPGTGKTYLVRGLLDSCPDAIFVMVPSNLISEIGGPSLVQAIMGNRGRDDKAATILIVEDADMCLAPRAADNMGSISALLNISDGILGNLLDIRILATTNAKAEDLDPAILRDGRLCRRTHVGNLTREQAEDVLKRLGGDHEQGASG
jgi:hypothetical protein